VSKTSILILSVLMASILAGCKSDTPTDMTSSELAKWIGKNVTIQFRRDALGAAADLPISPTTGSINGAEVTVNGNLLNVDATGITIGIYQRPNSRWIPKDVILFVELNP
jgi:hypothetical protein